MSQNPESSHSLLPFGYQREPREDTTEFSFRSVLPTEFIRKALNELPVGAMLIKFIIASEQTAQLLAKETGNESFLDLPTIKMWIEHKQEDVWEVTIGVNVYSVTTSQLQALMNDQNSQDGS